MSTTFNVGDRVAASDVPTIRGTVTLVYPDFGQDQPGYQVHWDHNINPDEDTIYTARSLALARPDGVPEIVTVDHAFEAEQILTAERHVPIPHGADEAAHMVAVAHAHAVLAQVAAIEALREQLIASIEGLAEVMTR